MGIIKAIQNRKLEREKHRELDRLIKEVCSDKSYNAGKYYFFHIFEEITPFLKPCPDCGGEAELSYHDETYRHWANRYVIRCTGKSCCNKMCYPVHPTFYFDHLNAEMREKYMRQIISNWNNQEEKL